MNTLEICNMALGKIGAAKISAISDKADINLQSIYNLTRDNLLIRYPWNFARAREILQPNEELPAFEWAYAYDLPMDFLGRPELYGSKSEFIIEGQTLLCNDKEVLLKYTSHITDASLFHSSFVECLILGIAAELAVVIANDKTLKDALLTEQKNKLLDAFLLNEYDNNQTDSEELTTWQQAGRGG